MKKAIKRNKIGVTDCSGGGFLKKMDLIDSNELTEIYRVETEPFGTNAYIVSCCDSKKAVLIDAPGSKDEILKKFKNTEVQFILMTHGHGDHTLALEELHDELGAPLAAHENDASMLPIKPDHLLSNGDLFQCGGDKMEVIYTPGHTPGSICFKIGSYLISGDTLFPGGPGKTGSSEDFKAIITSIKDKFLTLPDDTIILPGHGESTTVGKERPLIEAFLKRGYPEDLYGDVTWQD